MATLMDLAPHIARLEPHVHVVRPDGPGPFPVVLQLHDCSGLTPMQFGYAEAARDLGVAAVVLDSFTPRGIGRREAQLTVCTGMQLRGGERAADLLAGLRWLEGQPWADVDRVAAAGWSHGGWSIMEALAETPPCELSDQAALSRLRAAILFYPYAGPPSRTARCGWGAYRPKVYACLGGRDVVVGAAAPTRALQRLADDGLDVEVLTLPEATHCFDDNLASAPHVRYRADLAAEARALFLKALCETLGDTCVTPNIGR